MSERSYKIIHYTVKSIMTLIVVMFLANSIFNPAFEARFASLEYPGYLIYPMSVANLIGLAILWINGFSLLKEWAYAGFLLNFLLALLAELHFRDGEAICSSIAIATLLTSYFSQKQIRKNTTESASG